MESEFPCNMHIYTLCPKYLQSVFSGPLKFAINEFSSIPHSPSEHGYDQIMDNTGGMIRQRTALTSSAAVRLPIALTESGRHYFRRSFPPQYKPLADHDHSPAAAGRPG